MLGRSNGRRFRFFLHSIFALWTVLFGTDLYAGEFVNFIGMKFVDIPAGKFKMGSPAAELNVVYHELPQHQVEIQPFQLMATEVTLAHFKRYIVESSRVDIVTDDFMDANAYDNNAPVVFVSRHDVRNFLYWLNQQKPANDVGIYRLPSEAEWEYACRAGTNDQYCGGNMPSAIAWYMSNSVTHQQVVAQKKPNAFGLYDMSGNAREWVEDCYHKSYEYAPTDGRSWSKNCKSFTDVVVRGGSWNEGPEKLRVTERLLVNANSQSPMIGFRVVRQLR